MVGRMEELSTKANAFLIESILSSPKNAISPLEEMVERTLDCDGDSTKDGEECLHLSAPSPSEACGGEMESVVCVLEGSDLWRKFHRLNTEMIITKAGRRMFPSIRASFMNLDPEAYYWVLLDIVPIDNNRYRYAYHRSSWLVAGKADALAPSPIHVHHDSPFTGAQLMRQSISFEKIKLTNNQQQTIDHIILNSMHKYQPRIHLVCSRSNKSLAPSLPMSYQDLNLEQHKTIVFPETTFIAVTAYQNQLITKLKIESNPFAKGFRDSTRFSDTEREHLDELLEKHTYSRAPTDKGKQNDMSPSQRILGSSAYQLLVMKELCNASSRLFTFYHQSQNRYHPYLNNSIRGNGEQSD